MDNKKSANKVQSKKSGTGNQKENKSNSKQGTAQKNQNLSK